MKRTRIDEIALLIEKNGKMTLEELAEQFPDVSDMTLRRDLMELEQQNKVIRVRGGAMSVLEVQKRSGEAYAQKSTINTDAKKVIAKNEVNVMIPNPPSCINNRITTCPIGVKTVAVSTTVNPVTQTALVDVKRASRKLIPLYVAKGNCNSTAPTKTRNKKLQTNKISGFIRRRIMTKTCLDNCITLRNAIVI